MQKNQNTIEWCVVWTLFASFPFSVVVFLFYIRISALIELIL